MGYTAIQENDWLYKFNSPLIICVVCTGSFNFFLKSEQLHLQAAIEEGWGRGDDLVFWS